MLKNFILTPKGQFATAFGTGIVLTIVSAVISNASAPDYAVTLRLSHDRVAGSIADLSAYKFKELIEENSGGKVTVAIYPNNGLSAGDQQKAVEMLKDGAIDIQICSATDLFELDPRFGTFWLPFLFDSEEQAAFFASDATVAETIQSWLTPHNLDLLTMHTTGALQLSNNTREIDSPADLEGLKIRVAPSDFAGEVMSRLGAEPVELDFSEVPHALEQGEIQGLTSNLALYLSSKLYESQPYLTLWNGMYDIQVWVANEENLGKLDDQLKTAFTKSLTETVTWQHNLFTEFKKLYLKTLEQKGVTITTLTDGERIAFREKVKPIYYKYIEALGNDTLLFFLSHRGHDADQVEPLVPIEYNLQKNAEAAAEETVEALKEVTGEQAPAEQTETTPAETTEPAAEETAPVAAETPAETTEPAAEETAPVAEETPAETTEPGAEETAPVAEETAPVETTEPAAEASAPVAEETAPAETAEPAAEASAPVAEETAPVETTEPAAEETAPVATETAPVETAEPAAEPAAEETAEPVAEPVAPVAPVAETPAAPVVAPAPIEQVAVAPGEVVPVVKVPAPTGLVEEASPVPGFKPVVKDYGQVAGFEPVPQPGARLSGAGRHGLVEDIPTISGFDPIIEDYASASGFLPVVEDTPTVQGFGPVTTAPRYLHDDRIYRRHAVQPRGFEPRRYHDDYGYYERHDYHPAAPRGFEDSYDYGYDYGYGYNYTGPRGFDDGYYAPAPRQVAPRPMPPRQMAPRPAPQPAPAPVQYQALPEQSTIQYIEVAPGKFQAVQVTPLQEVSLLQVAPQPAPMVAPVAAPVAPAPQPAPLPADAPRAVPIPAPLPAEQVPAPVPAPEPAPAADAPVAVQLPALPEAAPAPAADAPVAVQLPALPEATPAPTEGEAPASITQEPATAAESAPAEAAPAA